MLFDSQQWGFDRQAEFLPRKTALINAASKAVDNRRGGARLELARFYFARDMYAEAKGVLDVALDEERATAEDATGLVMRGVANILMGRSKEGLKDVTSTAVGMQHDALLWRALASAKQGKWPEARDGFRKTETAIGMMPLELQREIYKEVVQASIEVGDFGGAATQLSEFETLSIPPEMQPEVSVLSGRIQEGLGHNADALEAYRVAAASPDRASAAQGRLREIALRFRLGDVPRTEVVTELENLTAAWRGDETEVEALQMLARLYTEEKRFRDAFNIMRTALQVHPDSDRTRTIQDDAATAFNGLFLGGKGDSMPPIEALSLFYDFREMTPIGRKGDEMIRRLADRLVAVDLLDQAAELLQHQVDHRLQGAARAQVATRLAVIYLMNRKPDRALGLLKATRTSELPNEIRNQRLLVEARALSDIGRHNLALEVIENVDTPDGARTRSDLLWAAKQFRESAEQIELLYADRWKDFSAYNDIERRDILRAAMGYNLAEDKLGLDRFKEKFAAGMMQSPDRRAFEVVTAPQMSSSDEFVEIARTIAAVDTLGQFLRDIRSGGEQAAAAGVSPTVVPKPSSQSRQSRPDYSPTGKIPKATRTSVR
jgi:tetratricopeptide (TPR) repeat protein